MWSLWDGIGSYLESCRHFFKHPQPLWVKVFPSWTRLLAELDFVKHFSCRLITKGLHSGRGFLENKRFFTCGTLKKQLKNRWTCVVRTDIRHPYYKGSPLCDHGNLFFFNVPQVKNRLFPTKPLPVCKPLRLVQFGQESCPAGKYLWLEKLRTADEI